MEVTLSNIRCLAVSDFNLQTFVDYLNQDKGDPRCEAVVAPFGQITSALLAVASGQAAHRCDALMIWTQPEAVVPAYEALLNYEPASETAVISEVEAFARQIIDAARKIRHVFVVTWSQPHFRRGLGIWSMRPEGCSRMLMKMNLELCDRLSRQSNVYVFDSSNWLAAVGPKAYSPKLWYLAKMPFTPEVFEAAAEDFKAGLRATAGQTKKLIVVDLDDTLWGGIVGEVGWENLRIGGHDGIGEAYADFQKALKALVRNGTVLAIASKNDEAVALEAIDKHPEMILRRPDFAAWRINWSDKAQNIVDIASELNLDPSAIVYIDDSPAERNRVRSALPSVTVPEWPQDVFLYASFLTGLPYFDKVAITLEDRQRTSMYAVDILRTDTKKGFQSIEEWLQSLQMEVSVEELSAGNLPRAAQLFNKTNQMNLTTRRLAESDLLKWSMSAGNHLYVFRVSDKFGDYGLTGILGFATSGEHLTITDYLLSCRVMGRGVEELMLSFACDHARTARATEIWAECVPTRKNTPCLTFFRERSHFKANGDLFFTWQAKDPYPSPSHISVAKSHAIRK
jgi:FkbH-like protein